MWFSAAVAHLPQDLMCCVIRDSLMHTSVVMSGYLTCNVVMLPLYQLRPIWPFSSDLCHQQGIVAHRTAAHCNFFLFRTILCKP